jgi:hypothetical protein
MHTYATALALVGVDVPGHLVADAEVPILAGPQAQGDLLIVAVSSVPASAVFVPVPAEGIQVVHGEVSGNTHWLHCGFSSPGTRWAPGSGHVVGYVHVPDGQSAQLIHTDEHGANGIAPGTYAIHRKRAAPLTLAPGSAESEHWWVED